MQTTSSLLARAAAATLLAAWVLPFPFPAPAQETPDPQRGRPLGWNLKNISPDQQQSVLRFSTFVNKGVPEQYLKAENSVGYSTKAIAAGGPLYMAHCAKCHGETGLGNGELAYVLTPSPALLAYMIQQPIAIDQYLLWTISEGGKQFDTAMPAFKSELTQEQIWQIVAYLRAGFPAVDDEGKPAPERDGASRDDRRAQPQAQTRALNATVRRAALRRAPRTHLG
jgi:mono/diheme cytochrome c family protein